MNWLVFIIFAVMAAMGVIGFLKGLARMVVPLVAVVLAAVLMWIFMPMLKTKIVDQTDLQETVYGKIYGILDSKAQEGEITAESFTAMKLPEQIEASVIEKYNSVEGAVSEKIEYTSRYLANIVVSLVVAGRIFLVFFVLLMLLSLLLKLTFKPKDKLTTTDHMLGGLLGILEGIILADVIFLLVTGAGYMGLGTGLLETITNNRILNYLYDHNLLVMMVKGSYAPTKLY